MVAAVAVAVALALAAAVPQPAPAGAAVSPNGRPVYVFGDSVLLGAKTAIEQRLAGKGWAPHVYAHVGVSMPVAVDTIRATRPLIGDVVVLGIGNNYFGNPVVFRREIDEVMDALRGVRRVVWLNLREFRPDRVAANAELAAAPGRWPNLEIADWNRVSLTRPNVFWADGLHLRPEGAQLMAELVDQRLDAYLAGAPPSPVPVAGAETPPVRPRVFEYGRPTVWAPVPPGLVTRRPFVGVASTRSGRGWWLAGSDGGVFTGGDARFRGSAGALPLRAPIVGIARTRSGRGYWLVASDGGVFSFGDARFYGSMGGTRLDQPVVGMARTPSGRGYWLVASDGGVFSFGDARFHGSTGGLRLARPVVGMAPTRTGRGYWLVAYDGGVFSFGDARFHGSTGGLGLFWPVVGMARAPGGRGYWLLGADGTVYPFGRARRFRHPGTGLEDLFVGIAARRTGGYWLLAQRRA